MLVLLQVNNNLMSRSFPEWFLSTFLISCSVWVRCKSCSEQIRRIESRIMKSKNIHEDPCLHPVAKSSSSSVLINSSEVVIL